MSKIPEPVEVYRDHEIFLTGDYKFQARINGKWAKRASIASLRSLINEQIEAVKVLVVREEIAKPKVAEVAKVHRGRTHNPFISATGEDVGGYWEEVYHYSKESEKELNNLVEQFEAAKKEYERLWKQVRLKMTKLTVEEFE